MTTVGPHRSSTRTRPASPEAPVPPLPLPPYTIVVPPWKRLDAWDCTCAACQRGEHLPLRAARELDVLAVGYGLAQDGTGETWKLSYVGDTLHLRLGTPPLEHYWVFVGHALVLPPSEVGFRHFSLSMDEAACQLLYERYPS